MALGSALQSGLSGLAAAETAIAVIANNMANAQTAGFKASSPVFATQSPQTQSLGAVPGGFNGGSNPMQIGRGVAVAGISAGFSQGSLIMQGGATNLAIEGEGLPQESEPRQSGAGQLIAGSAELSNTDIARSSLDLNAASSLFRANLQAIDTTSRLLDELTHLGRRK